jgi:hypothetical protein
MASTAAGPRSTKGAPALITAGSLSTELEARLRLVLARV